MTISTKTRIQFNYLQLIFNNVSLSQLFQLLRRFTLNRSSGQVNRAPHEQLADIRPARSDRIWQLAIFADRTAVRIVGPLAAESPDGDDDSSIGEDDGPEEMQAGAASKVSAIAVVLPDDGSALSYRQYGMQSEVAVATLMELLDVLRADLRDDDEPDRGNWHRWNEWIQLH